MHVARYLALSTQVNGIGTRVSWRVLGRVRTFDNGNNSIQDELDLSKRTLAPSV